MSAPLTKKPRTEPEKVGIFMKLLSWFLNLFGVSLGGGGVPLDDHFLKENRGLVKAKATEMAAHPLASTLISMGLKIPSTVQLVQDHLRANPELAQLAKEVINENSTLRDTLSKNKGFLEAFPDVVKPSREARKDTTGLDTELALFPRELVAEVTATTPPMGTGPDSPTRAPEQTYSPD